MLSTVANTDEGQEPFDLVKLALGQHAGGQRR
jgi:hypothetical protein